MNSPRSVLLVDDNALGMRARRRVLLDLGFIIETADCAEAAMLAIEAQKFDVVVTDYRMGQMSGVELIAHVKLTTPETRTVLLSAFVDPWGMTADSTGADMVIMKSATETAQLTRVLQSFFLRKKPVTSVKRITRANVVKNG